MYQHGLITFSSNSVPWSAVNFTFEIRSVTSFYHENVQLQVSHCRTRISIKCRVCCTAEMRRECTDLGDTCLKVSWNEISQNYYTEDKQTAPIEFPFYHNFIWEFVSMAYVRSIPYNVFILIIRINAIRCELFWCVCVLCGFYHLRPFIA